MISSKRQTLPGMIQQEVRRQVAQAGSVGAGASSMTSYAPRSSASPGAVATTTDPRGYRTAEVMAEFRRTLGYVRDGGVDVVCLGDSIFEGAYTTPYYTGTWKHRLTQLLQARFNPVGVWGGYGYMPFVLGALEGTRDAWNALFADTIPTNRIFWETDGDVIHDWLTNTPEMWTNACAARGVHVDWGDSGRIRYWFDGDQDARRAVSDVQVVGKGTLYTPKAYVDVFTTDAFGANGAGTVAGVADFTQNVPGTVARYGVRSARLDISAVTAAEMSIQIAQHASAGYAMDANGILLYNGDYDAGIRVHNLAVCGNWAYAENYLGTPAYTVSTVARASNVATVVTTSAHGLVNGNVVNITGAADTSFNARGVTVTKVNDTTFTYPNSGANVTAKADATARVLEEGRVTANIDRWCDNVGGATNARLFVCNLITNDYIFQNNTAAHCDLPQARVEYAALMDRIIAQPTSPVILWVIPPTPASVPDPLTYTYGDYAAMLYELAAARPQVAILDLSGMSRTAYGWGDVDGVHFTPYWQEFLAQELFATIAGG